MGNKSGFDVMVKGHQHIQTDFLKFYLCQLISKIQASANNVVIDQNYWSTGGIYSPF